MLGGLVKGDPTLAFSFSLQVEGFFEMPLKSVRVFSKENEFEYYQEGGLNDYVHMLRKPITKPFTFQVERYVGVSEQSGIGASVDPLSLGTELALPLVLNIYPPGKSGLLNFSRCYVFTGCVVIGKEFGELNSEQSRILTETTTIAYRELFIVNK